MNACEIHIDVGQRADDWEITELEWKSKSKPRW